MVIAWMMQGGSLMARKSLYGVCQVHADTVDACELLHQQKDG